MFNLELHRKYNLWLVCLTDEYRDTGCAGSPGHSCHLPSDLCAEAYLGAVKEIKVLNRIQLPRILDEAGFLVSYFRAHKNMSII